MSQWIFAIRDIAPKGKARPRVTKLGTYMPADYVLWKHKFALIARTKLHGGPHSQPIRVETHFQTATGSCRSDLDNAHAACLDALQDAGIITNDRIVKSGSYSISKSNDEGVWIVISTLNKKKP